MMAFREHPVTSVGELVDVINLAGGMLAYRQGVPS
jgi:hypothetical protein